MPVYALGDKRPRIHPTAWIHPDAVLIGDVWVDEYASIWPCAVIRADNSPVRIGARTSIQDGTVIHTQPVNMTRVGADCVIGHLVHLEGCTIEDRVLVGSNAVVLERVICRSGSLVGAGAMVAAGTEVPPRALAVGVPARIKPDAVNPEMILKTAGYYLEHLAEHRDGMRQVAIDSCHREDVFAQQ